MYLVGSDSAAAVCLENESTLSMNPTKVRDGADY